MLFTRLMHLWSHVVARPDKQPEEVAEPLVLSANWLEASCMTRHGVPAGKWAAAVTEIRLYSKQGRPVLVGTTSVERSEALATMLQQEGALLLLSAMG